MFSAGDKHIGIRKGMHLSLEINAFSAGGESI